MYVNVHTYSTYIHVHSYNINIIIFISILVYKLPSIDEFYLYPGTTRYSTVRCVQQTVVLSTLFYVMC